MRMQKGICIELDGDRSVYMLADGRFVTGRPQEGTAVGEEAFFESFSTTKMKRRRAKVFAMPVIAAVAVLILAISTFMMPDQEAYGYVQVETNPGIELGVDDEWKVISLRELNVDGRKLIEQLDAWENGTLEKVLENVLALSINDETEQVTITTVQGQGDTKTLSTVEQITLAALTANANKALHVHLKEASKEQWRQAKEQQVPVGQFAENNRTLTSPTDGNNDVQPAHNEDKEVEKANSKEQADPADDTERENPADNPTDEQSDDVSPAKPSNDAGNSQPVPAEKPQPAPAKENNGNKPEAKKEVPAAKKVAPKPASPSSTQPKNPNAEKGNNSTPVKPKAVPDNKKDSTGNKSENSKKENQPNSNNKQGKDTQPKVHQSKDPKQGDKQQKEKQAKQSNDSNKDPKGKSVSEENKSKTPQNNAPPKAGLNSGQAGNGQEAQNKNNAPSSSTDVKKNAPNSDKKAVKEDSQ